MTGTERLEQRKNEILKELTFKIIGEDWDGISFAKNGYDGYIMFSKRGDGIYFHIQYYLNNKQLKLIAELYEVMQYLGEV